MGCLQSSEKESDAPPATNLNEEAPKKVDPRLPFETYRQLFNFKNSWKVISRKLEDVAKDNLRRFLKQHPEHKPLHKDLAKFTDDDKMYESPAFENSAMSVFNTLDMAIDKMDKNVDDTISSLQRAGRMHVKLKDFDTAYFKDMEEAFIGACKEPLGERFTEATENNFRLVYQFACDQMIEGYNKSAGKQGASQSNRV